MGKHEKKGVPTLGNGVSGSRKPKKESLIARWANGAIQYRHTRKIRGTKGPFGR